MTELIKLLNKKNISGIRKYILQYPYAEIADMMDKLSPERRVILIRSLKTSDQSDLFSFLSPTLQKEIIMEFTQSQINKLIDSLYTEEAADILEDLPFEISQRILMNASQEKRNEINSILNYDDDVVGSIMSVDIVTLKQNWSVGQALNVIKDQIDETHFARIFYVVDAKNKLVGYVKTKEIIFENKKKSIKNFVKIATSVSPSTDKEVAAQIFAKHDMSSLPVVNSFNQVVGMITADYVIDVLQEEANEDFQVMAGIQATEVAYSKTSSFNLFKSRVLWLLLLMISATISQIVLDAFLNLANAEIGDGIKIGVAGITSAIVAILPVISGAAGNAGSQSSTTIIRALAIGDVNNKSYWKVFGKELKTSSLIGLTLGIANFARLLIYYSITGDINHVKYIALSGAASISLLVVIVLAQITGGLLPLFAKSIKIDPAVMAAPLLTTLIDALSTTIFFSITIGIMLTVL